MRNTILAVMVLFAGCGSDKTTEVKTPAQAPTNETLNCGDVNVSVNEAREVVDAALNNSVPVYDGPIYGTAKSGVVVVACGGTFVNDESQDNDTTTTTLEAVKKGLANGTIEFIEFK